jgi:hypothetical protein
VSVWYTVSARGVRLLTYRRSVSPKIPEVGLPILAHTPSRKLAKVAMDALSHVGFLDFVATGNCLPDGLDFDHWQTSWSETAGTVLRLVAITWPKHTVRQRAYLHLVSTEGKAFFGKVTWTDVENASLAYEAEFIESLTPRLQPHVMVPRCLSFSRNRGAAGLLQESVPARYKHGRLPAGGRLSIVAGYASPRIGPWPGGLEDAVARASAASIQIRHLQARLLTDRPNIALGVVHGDLTTANVFSTRSACYVIDWERARASAPVLLDLLPESHGPAWFHTYRDELMSALGVRLTLDDYWAAALVSTAPTPN